MDDEPRIVLIPRIPEDTAADVLFQTSTGFAVQAMDADVQAFRAQGIAVIDLYATGEDYVAAIDGLNSDDAIAAVETIQKQAVAALDPSSRDQFPVA